MRYRTFFGKDIVLDLVRIDWPLEEVGNILSQCIVDFKSFQEIASMDPDVEIQGYSLDSHIR